MMERIARSRQLRMLSIWLNRKFGSKELRTICSVQHGRKRKGLPNWAFLLDFILGEGHCSEAWVNYTLERRNSQ